MIRFWNCALVYVPRIYWRDKFDIEYQIPTGKRFLHRSILLRDVAYEGYLLIASITMFFARDLMCL